MRNITLLSALVVTLLFSSVGTAVAQESSAEAQANNPLANMTALNLHNYYIPKLTDSPDDAYMNQTWVRFARPFAKGKLLLRVSAPISTIATPTTTSSAVNSVNGLGDLNAFLSYNFVSKSTATVGAGPMFTAPTATEDGLGTKNWQGGLALVAFIAKSPVFQYGGLITYQTNMTDVDKTASAESSLMAIQPFYFFQLGNGTYLRGAPIWAFDFENDSYSVPVGLGIGKVVKIGKTVANLFVEPQYAMIHKGAQPQFQLFMGMNFQFTD